MVPCIKYFHPKLVLQKIFSKNIFKEITNFLLFSFNSFILLINQIKIEDTELNPKNKKNKKKPYFNN